MHRNSKPQIRMSMPVGMSVDRTPLCTRLSCKGNCGQSRFWGARERRLITSGLVAMAFTDPQVATAGQTEAKPDRPERLVSDSGLPL